MRAGPIGLISDRDEMLSRCELQAKITHDTPEGVTAALAASSMVHYFAHPESWGGSAPRSELGRQIETLVPGSSLGHRWDEPFRGKVGPHGPEAVHAAIQCIQESDSLADLLRRCVDVGGDVDTVAAIAMAAASCSSEITRDLPEVLVVSLEGGASALYGQSFLEELDRRLVAWAAQGPEPRRGRRKKQG
jgi:ADP-ribosylglycohydrolase